jgi:tRNA(fMet)-specific endonuclease VapC
MKHEAVEMLQIGAITADRYSRIAAQLRQQGTPIPTNDIWIAAQTVENGAELITTDKHFEKINGLVYTRV